MAKAAGYPAEGIMREERAVREVNRGQSETAEVAKSPAPLVSYRSTALKVKTFEAAKRSEATTQGLVLAHTRNIVPPRSSSS